MLTSGVQGNTAKAGCSPSLASNHGQCWQSWKQKAWGDAPAPLLGIPDDQGDDARLAVCVLRFLLLYLQFKEPSSTSIWLSRHMGLIKPAAGRARAKTLH